ncbi:MAG: cell division protein FtsL [Ilumatobacter sp.]|jgi:cell division protein FtsL
MAATIARQSPSPRAKPPRLEVVTSRKRWPAVVGSIVLLFVMVAMLGAAVFHTQLAERQLEIDQLDRQVQEERERFDELRRDRAVLRSPQRIADEAAALGMVRGATSRFIGIDPMALAMQLAAAGATDDDTTRVIIESGPLDQFRDVKSVSAGQP